MNDTLKNLGLSAMMIGLAWIVQTAGFAPAGLLSVSPSFLFLGAVVFGGGLGAFTWVILEEREDFAFQSRFRRLRQA